MSDDTQRPAPPKATAIKNAEIDTGHGTLGTGAGYSGEEFDSQNHAADKALHASAVGDAPPRAGNSAMPPDNGRRAFFDEKTGAVHGSGAGAGGGNEGEDFDSDAANGDGFPLTGAGPHDKT